MGQAGSPREGRGGKLEVPMRFGGNAPLKQDMEGGSINEWEETQEMYENQR